MTVAYQHILILGLGETGLAAARWLAGRNVRLRVADTRQAPERLDQLKACAPNSEFIAGEFQESLLDGIDLIIVSPGLSERIELATIVPSAQQRGIPIWSEIELFAQELAYLKETKHYCPKLIGITGTNGKTTVTRLVGLMVKRAGKTVRIAGNIQPSALDVLRTAIDENALPEIWVLELSSFQLHNTYTLQPDAATVLNLTPDHLDWHGTFDAYAADKAKIFARNTIPILNRDDPIVMNMKRDGSPRAMTFGASAPTEPNCFGVQTEHGMPWICVANAIDEEDGAPKRKQKGQLSLETEVVITRLMPADALKIRGRHNVLNAQAALALCRAIDLPTAALLHGLREYQGEPHRVQFVATINGVDYYDDSKGTNVYATTAAVNGLAKPGAHIVLIAGGLGKEQDFTPLREPLMRSVSAVMLIGQSAHDIAAVLEGTDVTIVHCTSIEQAVTESAAKASPGDMVLLSPACASWDMFESYVERGERFATAVREIALQCGEVM